MNTIDITRRHFLKTLEATAAALSLPCSLIGSATRQNGSGKKPNFIIIFCDDLGYGDVGCFGSKKQRTPNVDRMAAEGMKFTSFYVTSGVCTPSRSSLMTGCYPRRVNMHQSSRGEWVLFPVAKKGLNPKEITIAEVLKKQGYATACVGKWHLGDQKIFLPTRQGFDFYFGIPYSNDMGSRQRKKNPPLPLMRNERVIEAPADQNTLTKRYTEAVINFIKKNKDKPFFVYLPHTMPHNPVHSSKNFQGKSANDGYGDAVEEIDWSTGEILKTLKELDLDDNTLVVFTSDNGAASRWGGSNLPLSGWKGSTMEGGMREPCIMRWPGKVPAGTVCDKLAITMDLLPTFARLAGTSPPSDRIIDGKDIWPLMSGKKGAESPHEVFYYYFKDQLQAVRSGRWKLHLPRTIKRRGKTKKIPLKLFDLKNDIAEKKNIAFANIAIVTRLLMFAKKARKDLGDGNHPGENQRPAGLVVSPKPLKFAAIISSSSTLPASKKVEIDFNRGGMFGAWRSPTGDWVSAKDVFMKPGQKKQLGWIPGTGAWVNGKKGKTSHLFSKIEHGDVEAHVEFMIPEGSNSGVYFQGRYEIQVFDSWDSKKNKPKDNPTYCDCGGIYQRWKNGRGYEGHPPKTNACKAPGKWQTFDVVFRAPRFDAKGKKIANAVFVKVFHNGILVHENEELTGPTRASAFNDEKPLGPLMLQGDHGPVAYRNIRLRVLKSDLDKQAR